MNSISRSPLRNRSRSKSKSPAVGGGLRAQKGRDQHKHEETVNRLTREKERSSPLRIKQEPIRMATIESHQSRSRSPHHYTFESQAAKRALELTNTIEAARKSDKTSPLRKKSPNDMSFSDLN